MSKWLDDHRRAVVELFGPGLRADREALKDPVVMRAVVRALWRVEAHKGVEFPGAMVAEELGITEWAEHTADLEDANQRVYSHLYGCPVKLPEDIKG